MGSVERRNGKYRARYRDPLGRAHSKTFTRKADADRFVREMETEKDRGNHRRRPHHNGPSRESALRFFMTSVRRPVLARQIAEPGVTHTPSRDVASSLPSRRRPTPSGSSALRTWREVLRSARRRARNAEKITSSSTMTAPYRWSAAASTASASSPLSPWSRRERTSSKTSAAATSPK